MGMVVVGCSGRCWRWGMRKGERLARCKRGHGEWTVLASGKRRCVVCHRARQRLCRVRKKESLLTGVSTGV